MGYSLWGCKRVRYDLATEQQKQNKNSLYCHKYSVVKIDYLKLIIIQ